MPGASVIEIKAKMLEKNIHFLKKIIGEDVIFSSVVKGNAYGHGIEVVVPVIRKCGIDHFSVFSSEEARRVYRVINGDASIMIMGYIAETDLKWVIDHNIEFFVSDIERVKKALAIWVETGKKANIHIEVATGMNRT